MKQIYVESYYRNGYSRFMKYFNDILDHPKRESIEKRLEIIKFFDEFGAEATRKSFRQEPFHHLPLETETEESQVVSYLL